MARREAILIRARASAATSVEVALVPATRVIQAGGRMLFAREPLMPRRPRSIVFYLRSWARRGRS